MPETIQTPISIVVPDGLVPHIDSTFRGLGLAPDRVRVVGADEFDASTALFTGAMLVPVRLAVAQRPRIAGAWVDDPDRELLRLLCTSATISEIARRQYCSERSMYRRIRHLYDRVGVTGRMELMARAAQP